VLLGYQDQEGFINMLTALETVKSYEHLYIMIEWIYHDSNGYYQCTPEGVLITTL
jgi:hypothetical protein